MPTTSNFGWTTPADTDLVKDGAAAIRTLGNGVDSSFVDLKGGTTGQVLSKASNTDLDFTWVSNVTWTSRLQPTNNNFNRIAYNGSNLYVAAGDAGMLYTSPDGITWTSRTSGFGANAIYGVHWYASGSLWVITGATGLISTSPDGITWTARTANMGTNDIYDVLSVGSTIIAVGNGGGTTNTGGITYSTDAITWTRKSQSLTVGAVYYSITHNGTNWLVVASSSTNNYLYASTPSGTWTVGVVGGTNPIRACFYDGTRTYALRQSGEAYYSTSTTFASWTTMVDNIMMGNGGTVDSARISYYNGKVYAIASMNTSGAAPHCQVDYSTTPSSNNSTYFSSISAPVLYANFINRANAIWVGAAGRLLSVNTGIYSSF